jgi:hypothetical protein
VSAAVTFLAAAFLGVAFLGAAFLATVYVGAAFFTAFFAGFFFGFAESFSRADTSLSTRLNVQLIDAIRGYHIWARSEDRKLKEIFILQQPIQCLTTIRKQASSLKL